MRDSPDGPTGDKRGGGLIASVAPATAAAPSAVNVDGAGRRDVVALDPQRRGVVVARWLGRGRFATRRLPRLFRWDTGGSSPSAT